MNILYHFRTGVKVLGPGVGNFVWAAMVIVVHILIIHFRTGVKVLGPGVGNFVYLIDYTLDSWIGSMEARLPHFLLEAWLK